MKFVKKGIALACVTSILVSAGLVGCSREAQEFAKINNELSKIKECRFDGNIGMTVYGKVTGTEDISMDMKFNGNIKAEDQILMDMSMDATVKESDKQPEKLNMKFIMQGLNQYIYTKPLIDSAVKSGKMTQAEVDEFKQAMGSKTWIDMETLTGYEKIIPGYSDIFLNYEQYSEDIIKAQERLLTGIFSKYDDAGSFVKEGNAYVFTLNENNIIPFGNSLIDFLIENYDEVLKELKAFPLISKVESPNNINVVGTIDSMVANKKDGIALLETIRSQINDQSNPQIADLLKKITLKMGMEKLQGNYKMTMIFDIKDIMKMDMVFNYYPESVTIDVPVAEKIATSPELRGKLAPKDRQVTIFWNPEAGRTYWETMSMYETHYAFALLDSADFSNISLFESNGSNYVTASVFKKLFHEDVNDSFESITIEDVKYYKLRSVESLGYTVTLENGSIVIKK